MKKYILICFYCFTQSIYSQNIEEFKNINIPSPQAMEMVKFGNIEQNESKGAVNLNIPIYNYQAGEIQVPISLNATTTPVMVNQPPTWTGVTWTLNAPGVITRTVKDEPDDKNCVRFNYTYEYLNSNHISFPGSGGTQHTFPQNIVDKLRNENADSELDEFNFNFLNYSGTFVMKRDANNNPIPIILDNKDDIKIEIINPFIEDQYYYFIIRTPDGAKFTFGGNHLSPNNQGGYAIEESKFVLRNVDPTGSNGYTAKTAFYLTCIESYKGDKVFFDYETLPEYNVYYNTEQKLFQPYSRDGCIHSVPSVSFDEVNIRQVFNKINNGKVLYKIRSSVNNNLVVFENISILKNGSFYGKILTKIKFESKEVELKYYPEITNLNDFVYENSINKFFLTEVLFKDINNVLNQKYKLEYEDLYQVPKVNSFSQDHLGYFNGQSNSSLFPQDHFLLANKFFNYTFPIFPDLEGDMANVFDFRGYSNLIDFADRDGYFDFATNGIIKKIIYPTGGYTSFGYEPVMPKPVHESVNLFVLHNPTPSGSSNSVMEKTYNILNSEVGEDGEIITNELPNQTVEFTLNFGGSRIPGYQYLDYRDFIYVQIKDLTTNSISEQKLHLPAEQTDDNLLTEVSAKRIFTYQIKSGHNYQIKVGFGDNIYSGNYINTHNPNWLSNIAGSLSFRLLTGFNPNDGMGVRLKNVKDFDTNAELKNAKRYYYKKLSDIVLGVNEHVDYNWLPQYFDYYTYTETTNCFDPVVGVDHVGPVIIEYNVFTTNSNASISPSKFHSNTYKYLTTVYGESGYENGAIEKEFRVKKDQREYPFIFDFFAGSEQYNYANSDSLIMPFPLFKILRGFKNNGRTENISKGEIVREALFSKDGTVLKKKKETFYQYISFPEGFEEIGNINIISAGCPLCPEFAVGHLYLGMYKTRINKNFLTQKRTKEYIDGIPITLYHENFKVKANKFWDFDGDGIANAYDLITEEEFDEHFKYVFNKSDYWYGNQTNISSLLERETTFYGIGNDNVKKTKYYYPKPNNISQLINLNATDSNLYQLLYTNYNFKTPIQIETYLNDELISTSRNTYCIAAFSATKPLLYKSLSSKGANVLESNFEITKYDIKGNPTEVKRRGDFFTAYIWSPQRQLLAKAENTTIYDFQAAITNTGISLGEDGITSGTPTTVYQNLPNTFISFYQYDPISKKLIKEIDPNNKVKTYEYDTFYDLEFIKDHDGNIVKEFDQHFKPQN